uniref:CW domain-containing protein n=1 Tax=Caenorhabditis tropicalis TaxID=1561998 RepID=A0A1I7U412_9PELO
MLLLFLLLPLAFGQDYPTVPYEYTDAPYDYPEEQTTVSTEEYSVSYNTVLIRYGRVATPTGQDPKLVKDISECVDYCGEKCVISVLDSEGYCSLIYIQDPLRITVEEAENEEMVGIKVTTTPNVCPEHLNDTATFIDTDMATVKCPWDKTATGYTLSFGPL